MNASDRAIDVLLGLCEVLDFLYFPGRYLRPTSVPRFRREEFRQPLHYLCRRGLLQEHRDASGWVYRLTDEGRQRMNRGLDPSAQWKRGWDGVWRQVIFDIPTPQTAMRARLLYWFRAHRFGYLQDSVWITPDPLDLTHSAFRNLHATADMVVFMESRVTTVSSNSDVVTSAWNFKMLQKAYARHAVFLKKAKSRIAVAGSYDEAWPILKEERHLWREAVGVDPLLPRELWPETYMGADALAARRHFLQAVRKTMKALRWR